MIFPTFYVQPNEPEPERHVCREIIPRVLSWGSMASIVYWFISLYSFHPSSNLIGYHALGFSIFSILCNQELVMTLVRKNSMMNTYWYVFMYVIGLIVASGGMASIFYKNNLNLTSSHSWLGLGTLGMGVSQGIVKYMYPQKKSLHLFLSTNTYVLGLTTCSLGMTSSLWSNVSIALFALSGITSAWCFFM
jgi:hypothetical protein